MSTGDVAFGSLNLNDGAIHKVLGPLPIVGSGPDLASIAMATREGGIIAQSRYPAKTISMKGITKGTSASDRETNFDALLKGLNNGLQNLKTGWQDERIYAARLQGHLDMVRQFGTSHFEWVANFRAEDPFAYAASASQLVSGTALSSVAGSLYRKTLTPTVGGSIYAWPNFTVGVHTGGSTPWGITTITVRNVTTGEEISVSRTFATSDSLTINGALQTVQVGGVDVDYYGSFPSLDPRPGATNSIQVDAVGTSAPTLDVTIDWTARYA